MRKERIKISIEKHNDCAVLRLDGYINDLGAEHIEETCSRYLSSGARNLVLNFAKIELINSIGISILIGVIDKVMKKGGSIYFTNVNNVHRQIFRLLELSKYAIVLDNEQDAVKRIAGKKEIQKEPSQ
jgi:anti-anti-sigma factor